VIENDSLGERLAAGDRGALARLISWAENGDPRFASALAPVWSRVGRAWRSGVTGPPGAGKSTLVNALAGALRGAGKRVGILAVDPTSPFTGGALLGDRIRMEERSSDAGVFIRSMASRGSHGGLSRAAVDACDSMDIAGIDEILLETVGVGQAEFDVMSAVDTVVVALCPGAGDGVQAMKAGILEVADVLVVNKSDVAGADRLVLDLEESVAARIGRAREAKGGWKVPVVALSAALGRNIDGLVDALRQHRAHLERCGLARARRERRLEQVRRVMAQHLDDALWGAGGVREAAERDLAAGVPPYDVASRLAARVLRGATQSSRA
jgi:LAO/AO transport system kinase